ncbi:MAG: endonuclease domain-containing protein [Bacteroidota bacterium]
MSKNIILPYRPYLKKLARELRKNSTLSEVLLWNELKGKKMLNCEFHRQVPIDNYIVDFYCREWFLAIEIDGESHQYKVEEDKIRQERLETLGIHFLHFSDKDPKQNMTYVLKVIQDWIEESIETSL